MINRWNDDDEQKYIYQNDLNIDEAKGIVQQAYATSLLGAESDLTIHGGGNTSVKILVGDNRDTAMRVLCVKASGTPLASFIPKYFVSMDLSYLERLNQLDALGDKEMADMFEGFKVLKSEYQPSIESTMHAFIPAKYVNHTHPVAVLKILNRVNGIELFKECFGDELAVIPYARLGFDFAKAALKAVKQNNNCKGIAIAHHGLVTWGQEAREAYERTIGIVTKAEDFLSKISVKPVTPQTAITADSSKKYFKRFAPVVRNSITYICKGAGFRGRKISFSLLNAPDVLDLINSRSGRDIICNPPMTPDYPMLNRILPLWIDVDLSLAKKKIVLHVRQAVAKFIEEYIAYLNKHDAASCPVTELLPKVIIHPQIGAVCCGLNQDDAQKTADLTHQAFSIRRAVAETGGVYESLPEKYLFDMQYKGYQQAKKQK
ncbi:MAG: class II aldolase/adducin family protein [Chitinispirillales bacterium]|jgi:rhamnose utilization protein RhaD (predicted bifunctional aldolase and dehydrogenase)|nr:class II aldolase/adducin family protein [Chitinispirillales bacterium]